MTPVVSPGPPSSATRVFQVVLAAALLVPAVVFVGAAYSNRLETLRAGQEATVRTAAAMHEHAAKVLDTIDLVLSRVDDRIRDQSWDQISAPETSDFLRALKRPLAQAVSIWIADKDGVVRAGSQDWDRKVNIADRDFFRAQVERNAGTYISLPFTGRATRTPSFAMSRRRSTPDGRFDGTIHVALSPDYFARFYEEMAPAGGHAATLVRRDGTVLVRDPPLPSGEMAKVSAFTDAPDRQEGRVVSMIDGVDRLFATRRVAPYPVFVVFARDVSSVLDAWWNNLKLYGLVALAASLTLVGVSSMALRRFGAEQLALRRLQEETSQRLAAEQRLLQSQKMESIGQLTGGIAHDFNNLLAVIIGNLELARKRMQPDARVSRLLETALQGAQRGASLTQRLLAFARKQDLAPDVVDVAQLVRSMGDLMRRSIGHAVQIDAAFPPGLPPVRVDPHQLELTLLNLAVNARDAMPEGGRIGISAREETVGASNALALAPGSYVCIRVTDTGVGMDEATLALAAEPFFTTKGVGKGTGLGLSMAHGFAVQSGGAMRLLSLAGHGTTVELWLPRAQAEPRSAEPQAEQPHGAARGYRVLLVEDDPLVMLSTAAMLEDLEHHVTQAESGARALELLGGDEPFDLVVSDFSMPGMNGLQLAERIRASWPDLPILITSGQSEIGGAGRLDLPRLAKPYRQEDLARAIDRLLGPRAVAAAQ
ncbi:response regulator [Alsobacter sp. SYSU M60028]|uniref:histidine kinase n=1 Tax=Alsobacter ponti TaxID=2962936 RepID=A0ABT1LHG5_9HYPH|nr:response regulator [Alsobacter ponti]MCP8940313.1 response regulator [Alsobacter ponti]